MAQTNLDYTVIRSPTAPWLREMWMSDRRWPHLQAPTIFTIAQDLTKMWVYAKTDESDVDNIQVGKKVHLQSGRPAQADVQGRVSQVRMNPTMVQSVVTYDTIIEFANPELKLFPGMTAYVTIPVSTAANAVKLPNTALRYKPPFAPEEVLALYKPMESKATKNSTQRITPLSKTVAPPPEHKIFRVPQRQKMPWFGSSILINRWSR